MGNFSNLIPTALGETIAVAVIEDQKPSGTAGGSLPAGAWRTRDLNTITSDDDSIVTLSANQFTLQAGTYLIEASAPSYVVSLHKIKLYNITDSTDDIIGTNAFSSTPDYGATRSFASGVINITSAKVFEIQHRCSDTGFIGNTCNFGVAEVYTQVKITKLGA